MDRCIKCGQVVMGNKCGNCGGSDIKDMNSEEYKTQRDIEINKWLTHGQHIID